MARTATLGRRRAMLNVSVLLITIICPGLVGAQSSIPPSSSPGASSTAPPSSSPASSSPASSAPPASGSPTPIPGQDSFWMDGFKRLKWASSLVVDDALYIDGGELWDEDGYVHALGSTVRIQLGDDWSPSTVSPEFTDKPVGFPLALGEYIWYNEEEDLLQVLPGTIYPNGGDPMDVWSVASQDDYWTTDGEPQNLWKLNAESGVWHSNPEQPPGDFLSSLIQFMIGVATPSSWFGLGGTSSGFAFQSLTPVFSRLWEFDFASNEWSNATSKGYGQGGFGTAGQAVYSDVFGEKGVLIYIGGYAPPDMTFSPGYSTSLEDMSVISIYDIANGEFFTQTATGPANSSTPIPPRRMWFCATAASEPGGKTLDVFIHGGIGGDSYDLDEVNQDYDQYLAGIWILSLPSFIWTWVPDSDKSMRHTPTCETIGNHYMVVIGGDDPSAEYFAAEPDPFPNGIGLFDMSSLKWTDAYTADGASYARASVVADAVSLVPLPRSWGSDGVRALFDPTYKAPAGSAGGKGSGSEDDNDNTNVGAIAGGVVGGIVGLAVVAVVIWLILRSRRRKKAQTGPSYNEVEDTAVASSGWKGATFYEKEGSQPANSPRSDVTTQRGLYELSTGQEEHELEAGQRTGHSSMFKDNGQV